MDPGTFYGEEILTYNLAPICCKYTTKKEVNKVDLTDYVDETKDFADKELYTDI